MTSQNVLLSTTTLASILFGTAAFADLTPEDVWANHVAYYSATGASVSGTLVTESDRTSVMDAALRYTLPFGAGTIQATLPPLIMTPDADGTITLEDPGSFDITISATIENETVAATLTMVHDSYVGTVSGTADDMTYHYVAGPFAVALSDVVMPEDGVDMTLTARGEGYDVTTRIANGDLIIGEATSLVGPMTVDYAITSESFLSTQSTTYGASEAQSRIALVPGGASILNLTPALKAGMGFALTSSSENSSGSAKSEIGGVVISEQTQETGPTTATFALDAAGFSLNAVVETLLLSVQQPDILPFPIDVEAGQIEAGYAFPVIASADPQPASFKMALADLRLSPGIWALFDPDKQLPRDPMSLTIDLEGTTISDVDLFDVLALEEKFAGAVPPFLAETLTVNALDLKALGGSISGTADVAFDNSDLETYDGLPKPVGEAFVAATGVNHVMDLLSTVGLIGPEEISAARLGLGFLARATGDDSFETTVTFSDDGQLSLNGQRIR